MGHTLIALFDGEAERIVSAAGIQHIQHMNKIPVGKPCDREAANRVLPYHLTLLHWSRKEDAQYLPCAEKLRFSACTFRAEKPRILKFQNGSRLLYLPLVPERGFAELQKQISAVFHAPCDPFLHMTLAAGSADEIDAAYRAVSRVMQKPVIMQMTALALYHIWTPTKCVRRITRSK